MTKFLGGMLKVAKFYWLKSNHETLLHFLGNNEFEIKIVDLNKSKIYYPIDIQEMYFGGSWKVCVIMSL